MMERSPDDRFANYRELRTALENVHSFRYETMPLEAPLPSKPLSVPRAGGNTQCLHGLLAQTKTQWTTSQTKTSASIQLSRAQVEESMQNRVEPLKVQSLVNTFRDLCKTRAEDPDSLAEAMEKVPGLDPAVRALVNFMVNPQDEAERAENLSARIVLETLGLERGRNLGLTFFALNYECPKSANFDWTPLWRHQLSVAVVMDFIYDALDLKRTGLEYAAGMTHDIGKLILSELFPFAYFSVLNRSLQEELSLVACEMEMFGLTHAEIGAQWLKQEGFSQVLVDAVARHETPEKIQPRALLGHGIVSANQLVKQIGLGYSGNALLDSRMWEELPSTGALWEARGNKAYLFNDFARDILGQFEAFPDLI
jgi:putative nucleotidyltransferase with HDIG domain